MTPANLRHRLHDMAELSGAEVHTAQFVAEQLAALDPQHLVVGLGGHGVAARFNGRAPGPTVLLRAELDALPTEHGAAHNCGHDGHMAALLGAARLVATTPLESGSAVFLFQPAEETGEGAALVLADPRFQELKPDLALAFHNLPGFPLGAVVLREGVFASASVGVELVLRGATSHASQPNEGRSPVSAACHLASAIPGLPQTIAALHEAALATVIHLRVGERAFGTTPGQALICATLRAHDDVVMARLLSACEALGRGVAAAHGLDIELRSVEPFPATVCAVEATRLVEREAIAMGLPVMRPEAPFPWSEDFGHVASLVPAVLFGLGSGQSCKALHHPGYEFPDALLEPATQLLERSLRRAAASAPPGSGA